MTGVPAAAYAAALTPPRVHGGPLPAATLRGTPEDFQVEEELGFAPSGSGSHLLLRVRKRDANTQWVARELATLAGCLAREVGYAGLKDRRSLSVQWFSVPRPRKEPDWLAVRRDDFQVLEAVGHHRKLPLGALAANRFAVRLRAAHSGAQLAELMAAPLRALTARGVPNYFGPQRFGRDGANLVVPRQLGALARAQRGFVLSAARSAVFNAVLAARVQDGSWQHLLPGDLANLDSRGSFFAITAADEGLAARCARLEIHPTGPLWGNGAPPTDGQVHELEARVAAALPAYSALCAEAGMRQERRSLRLAVQELSCEIEPDTLLLRFRLPRGCFATAVLRELIEEVAADVPAG